MTTDEERDFLKHIDPGFASTYHLVRCLLEELGVYKSQKERCQELLRLCEETVQRERDAHLEVVDKLNNDLTDPAFLRRRLRHIIKSGKRR